MRTRTRVAAALASSVLLAGAAVGITTINPATAAPAKAPAKVGGVTTTSGNASYTVKWKKPKGKVDRYQVADRAKKKGGWTGWKTKNAKKVKAKVKGKNGSKHQVRVRAHNGDGWGKWSKKAKVTIGLPAAPKGVAVAAAKQQATVSWKAAKANGSKVKSYTVQTKVAGGAWKSAKAGAKATSLELKNLAVSTKVEARVRATNKVGKSAWSKVASGTTFPKPNPTLTVDVSGPYKPGQQINASFSGFPYDHPMVAVAFCLSDPAKLMTLGGGACSFAPGSGAIAPATNGAGTVALTIPTGMLGIGGEHDVDCTVDDACAIVASTITSDFHMADPILVEYADPKLVLSENGPFDGGETVTASFSGFPGDHPMVAVAVCLADPAKLMTLGGAACNFAPGSGEIASATNGAGSAELVIPTGMLGIGGEHDVDCRAPNSCAIVASTITSDFHMADPVVLEYLPI